MLWIPVYPPLMHFKQKHRILPISYSNNTANMMNIFKRLHKVHVQM